MLAKGSFLAEYRQWSFMPLPFPIPKPENEPSGTAEHPDGAAATDDWVFEFKGGDILLNPKTREINVDDRITELTPRELDIFRTIGSHLGNFVSLSQIMDEVWGTHQPKNKSNVRIHVFSIRKKLGSHTDLIQNVQGVGYRFNEPGDT